MKTQRSGLGSRAALFLLEMLMKTETAQFVYGFMWLAERYCAVKEDAEDIMQDLLIKLVVKAEWFESLPENEKINIITTSIRNKFIDGTRRIKKARRYISETDRFRYARPDAPAIIELKELKEKTINDKNCETVFLFAEGYSTSEIGTIVGASQNTVLGKMFRGRKFLKS